MIGETLKNIWAHAFDENAWFLVETDKAYYSLRMGGFMKEKKPEDMYAYDRVPFEFENQVVKVIYSDDFFQYIITEQGGVISHGDAYITGDGKTLLSISFNSLEELEQGLFDEAFFQLDVDANGNSVRRNNGYPNTRQGGQLNNTGLEREQLVELNKTWDLIQKHGSAKIVFDDEQYGKCEQLLLKFTSFPDKWQIKNLFELEIGGYVFYFLHIEIDLGHKISGHGGLTDLGIQYRLWCICPDFPAEDLVIKEREITNNLAQKLLRILNIKEGLDVGDKKFREQYEVHTQSPASANQFLKPELLAEMKRIQSFTLSVENKNLFMGIGDEFTTEQAQKLLRIATRLAP